MYNLEVFTPQSLNEALKLKKELSNSLHILAGGTDVLVGLRNKKWNWGIKPKVLNLNMIKNQLNFVKETKEFIEIGALVTHTDLIYNQIINSFFPSLVSSLKIIGSPQIRNQGTLVGNIMNASPAADSLPVLYARNSKLEITTSEGVIIKSIEDVITGPGQVDINPAGIVTKVIIPKLPKYIGDYMSIRQRYSLSINVVSLGIEILYNRQNNIIEDVRIALGAVAPTVIRARKTEKYLENKKLTKELLMTVHDLVQTECKPIDDVRSDKEYRRAMTGVLLKRFLRNILISKERLV